MVNSGYFHEKKKYSKKDNSTLEINDLQDSNEVNLNNYEILRSNQYKNNKIID